MSEQILKIEKLSAGYGDTVVLEGVSLTLQAGSALALLGRNGVGKTTLLTTLLGLNTVHAGVVRYLGADIAAWPAFKRARAGLGLVPQEREIFPSLTVEENLMVSRSPGEWSVKRIYELFPRLQERRNNLGNQLSGGEQQMLAIARALVGNPNVLLLDEPFEGLAPVIVDGLVDALRALRSQSDLALILVEQHAEIALELTDQAMVLDRGRTVWAGESALLLSDPVKLSSLIGLAIAES